MDCRIFNLHMWSFCTNIHTHAVPWAYGLIFLQRTFVESAPDFESRVISGQVQNQACHNDLSIHLKWCPVVPNLASESECCGSVLTTPPPPPPPVSIGCQINMQPKPVCPVVCLIYCRRVGGSISNNGNLQSCCVTKCMVIHLHSLLLLIWVPCVIAFLFVVVLLFSTLIKSEKLLLYAFE